MDNYLALFCEKRKPTFLKRYLSTKTLKRLKSVTQFCGCDYTALYQPRFLYTRFDHSLVVAYMTWHFTHDKKETIAALLHDVGTPCFAHVIDFVLGDSVQQESSEKKIVDVIAKDEQLLQYLKEDGLDLSDFVDYSQYSILENRSPRLCTDRLDGVLHTCYIWLHTHSLEELKQVYNDLVVLSNEDGKLEIGFQTYDIALKFVEMVAVYAKELQGNKDKYVMQFVAEIVKLSLQKHLITLEDLYQKREAYFVRLFQTHFPSWFLFEHATVVTSTERKPSGFSVCIDSKKRNVIPLIKINGKIERIINVSHTIKSIYNEIASNQDVPYAYIESIQNIDS